MSCCVQFTNIIHYAVNMPESKLTKRQAEALRIIHDRGRITARMFAELFWQDHVAHRKVSNGGHGAQAGKAGWLMGGSYLGRLRKNGYTVRCYPDDNLHTLTREGLKQLELYECHNG